MNSNTAQRGMKTRDGQFLTTKTKQYQEIRAIRLRGLDDKLDVAFALEYFRRQQPHLAPPKQIKIAPDDGDREIKTNCFWTKRGDSNCWESLWMAIPTNRELFSRVLRAEIQPQIVAFRGNRYGQVDHKEPLFHELADSFVNEHCNGNQPDFEVDVPNPGLVDRAIASKWQSFHKEKATLQLLTKEEHKQKTSIDMKSYWQNKSGRTTRPPITNEQRARIEANRLAALQRKRKHKRKIEADQLAAHERQHKR
jgi:hypothetical protein